MTARAPRRLDARTLSLAGRLVREYVRPHGARLALAGILMAITAAATATNAWLMQPILDELLIQGRRELLYALPVALIAIALVKGGATYGEATLSHHAGLRAIADMQSRLFAHLMRSDLQFFHDNSTGSLISRFTADVNLLRSALTKALLGIAKDSLEVAFLVGVMFYQDWRLAALATVVLPAAILPVLRLGRRMRRASANNQVEMGQLNTLLDETFEGARHVKAYGMEAHESRRAADIFNSLFRLTMKIVKVRARGQPIMEGLSGVAVAAIVFYGGSQAIEGNITPGALTSFIAALIMAYRPLKSLASLNADVQEGLAAAERVFALMDLEPTIADRPGARPLQVGAGTVELRDVRFSYAPDKPALGGVSLAAAGGRTLALVGPSGGGKSTIINLIARFYDPDSGAVLIDGTDVRDATLASLRGAIALVSQEISLFDDTVRANIAYGRIDAPQSEIEAAARNAGAHDFIVALPQGYATRVGEAGVRLSGGQRQRIAIARAMLKNAPILLLDEATSALDSETERQIQEALSRLMQGRTTIIVAHRLSTVVDADLIAVIEGGRVVEQGRHAELVARGGVYARLYSGQAAGEARPEPRLARG